MQKLFSIARKNLYCCWYSSHFLLFLGQSGVWGLNCFEHPPYTSRLTYFRSFCVNVILSGSQCEFIQVMIFVFPAEKYVENYANTHQGVSVREFNEFLTTRFFYKKLGSAPSTKSFLISHENFAIIVLKVS